MELVEGAGITAERQRADVGRLELSPEAARCRGRRGCTAALPQPERSQV